MKHLLMMTKVSLDGLWTDAYEKVNTQDRNIDTVEKALEVIDIVYADSLIIHDYEISETEIWVICENDVTPCTNCPNTP
tara:strand:- start:191 stop:427 length:237 start_codon:yes stop_codon:yes gene_type:complete